MSLRLYIILGLNLFCTTTHAVTVHEIQYKGKTKAYLVEDHTYPILSVAGKIEKSGCLSDPVGQEGKSYLMMQLLSLRFDKEKLSYRKLGVSSMNFNSGRDYFRFSFEVPLEKSKKAISTILQDLLNFKPDAVELRRSKYSFSSAYFNSESASPDNFLERKWIQLSYPHIPEYQNYSGTMDSIESFNPQDFDNYWKERLTQENVIFSIVGDMSPAQCSEFIAEMMTLLPEKSQQPLSSKFEILNQKDTIEPQIDGSVTLVHADRPQSHVFFGQKGLSKLHPDFYTLQIASSILGQGTFTSRLWIELREKKGSVYNVLTRLDPEFNYFFGFLSTSNDKVAQSIEDIRKVFQELKTNGITAKELEDAKKQLIGTYMVTLTNLSGIANAVIKATEEGNALRFVEGYAEKINQVTLQDVNKLVKSILDPEGLRFVVLGNPTSESSSSDPLPAPLMHS
jgi:zinc protease